MNTVDCPSDSGENHSAEGLEEQLAQYLLATRPARVVIVGQPPITPGWEDQPGDTGPQVMPFDTLEQCLATLPDLDEEGADETAERCVALMQFKPNPDLSGDSDLAAALGQAVRRFPGRLIISVDNREPEDAAFFAFGFRKLQLGDQESIRLFEYCLSEYKQVPDWLNARYWANPERFGLTDDQDSYSEDGEDDEEE